MAELDRDLQRVSDALHRGAHRPFVNALAAIGFLALLVLAGLSYDEMRRATDARHESVALARDLGEQMAASPVCQSTDPTVMVQFRALCDQAFLVRDQAEPNPQDVQQLIATVTALVMADLPARVDAAVQESLRRHPPKGEVSPEEVTPIVQAVVTTYLLDHPLVAPPTAEQVIAATATEVQAWFERNPPPAGPQGEPGPGPSFAQVQAAVDAWFASHPPIPCPGVWTGPKVLPSGATGYECEVPR